MIDLQRYVGKRAADVDPNSGFTGRCHARTRAIPVENDDNVARVPGKAYGAAARRHQMPLVIEKIGLK
jgi:hypothetical protein